LPRCSGIWIPHMKPDQISLRLFVSGNQHKTMVCCYDCMFVISLWRVQRMHKGGQWKRLQRNHIHQVSERQTVLALGRPDLRQHYKTEIRVFCKVCCPSIPQICCNIPLCRDSFPVCDWGPEPIASWQLLQKRPESVKALLHCCQRHQSERGLQRTCLRRCRSFVNWSYTFTFNFSFVVFLEYSFCFCLYNLNTDNLARLYRIIASYWWQRLSARGVLKRWTTWARPGWQLAGTCVRRGMSTHRTRGTRRIWRS
jgi:hypothetical protein